MLLKSFFLVQDRPNLELALLPTLFAGPSTGEVASCECSRSETIVFVAPSFVARSQRYDSALRTYDAQKSQRLLQLWRLIQSLP